MRYLFDACCSLFVVAVCCDCPTRVVCFVLLVATCVLFSEYRCFLLVDLFCVMFVVRCSLGVVCWLLVSVRCRLRVVGWL